MQKNFLLILIIALTIAAQENIKMNSKPLAENAVELTEVVTLMDEEIGFYDRTIASISPKGHVVVADAGNKLIYVYDKNYKLLRKFGKEGNGPGEIDRIGNLKATSDRIYVSSFRRMIIFTYTGEFISEINLFEYGSSRQIINDSGVILYYSVGNPKYKTVSYSKDGKELKKTDNLEYEEPKEQQRGMRMMIFSGNGYLPYSNGYVNSANGEYGIEIIDKNFNINKVYTRTFDRIQRNMDDFQFSFKAEGASKKQQEQMRKAAQKQMMAQLGEYKDDIAGILGVYNDYIFARIASEDDKEILIDVISPDMKYYTAISIQGEEYESARIEEGKLIVNYKNDDDGPFVKIYDIKII